MPEHPSMDEIAALLAEIKASPAADGSDVAARKADLLERIAETMPGDAEAHEIARNARAAAVEWAVEQ